jgi:hypothetical protein
MSGADQIAAAGIINALDERDCHHFASRILRMDPTLACRQDASAFADQ